MPKPMSVVCKGRQKGRGKRQQRIAVRLALVHVGQSQQTRPAGLVDHHQGLIAVFRRHLGQLAGHQIHGAAGLRMNDDLDRLRREIRPRSDRVHRNQSDDDKNKQCPLHSYHLL